ncbi:MAG: tryptophan--tRNA ligase, partial [Candidatus Thorarchaeota archaeon]
MSEEKDNMVVTPYKVSGTLDYDRLIKEFGTQRITDKLKEQIFKIAGEKNLYLERDLFFSHRDLDWILN